VIVVSDSSPLIALASVGQLSLLQTLYGRVAIPEAVRNEVAGDVVERPGSREVLDTEWIEVIPASDTIERYLVLTLVDRGEAEAIALAIQLDAELLIVDDRRARAVAEEMGVRVTGVVGVLLEAKQHGLVAAVKPILDAMSATVGFRLSRRFYDAALQSAGEIDG
jgi:predicted nucleic acid-binding protein